MRKWIMNQSAEEVSIAGKNWINLEGLARAEVSSEDAAQPGKQTVRLLFDKPQKIRSIRLVFQENEQERTHEFVLRWSPDSGQSYREIARQQ